MLAQRQSDCLVITAKIRLKNVVGSLEQCKFEVSVSVAMCGNVRVSSYLYSIGYESRL